MFMSYNNISNAKKYYFIFSQLFYMNNAKYVHAGWKMSGRLRGKQECLERDLFVHHICQM